MVERVVIPQYWETITCACGAEDYVQAGTVEDYRRARCRYLCHRCREAERRSVEQAGAHTKTILERTNLFDKWGRRLDK